MIACQGDEQKACQVRPDQPLEAVGSREAIVGAEGCAMGNQQVGSPGNDTAVSCSAHATTIGLQPAPASSLTGVKPVISFYSGGLCGGAGAVRSATVGRAGGSSRAPRGIGPVVSKE